MPLIRSELSTGDEAVTTQFLSASFADGFTMSRAGDLPFLFKLTSAADDIVAVSSLRIDGRVTAAMDGSRAVIFTDIAWGRYAWRSRAEHGDQRYSLILPSGHELAVELDTVRSVQLSIDTRTVERWLARYGGLPPSPALLNRAAAGSEPVRHAIRLYGQLASSGAFDSDLVRANLLDLLLSVTAHHLLPDATPAQASDAPTALKRAGDFLRSHAAEAVSIADAADAARLSVRGLQDQFRKWLGMTPAQYLRHVRLDGARADLISARLDGRPDRVADVARRWGFIHLGRFAAYYAEAFGETPARTLRSDRPRLR